MKIPAKFLIVLVLVLAGFPGKVWAGYYSTPALPVINTGNVVNVTSYGAVGDNVTTNTTAIQNAINAAAAGGTTNGAAGGTVEIPPGIYLCGPLTMKSAVNLQIDAGAILRMLSYDSYPGGIVSPANFLSASSLHDVELSGSGAIDGQGAPWWPGYKTNNRPVMISWSSCNRELIQNVTLSNSPEFHIAIGGHSGNTTVRGVTVRAPASSDPVNPSHNTDACDISGTNALVMNCDISTGDDDFTCGGGTSGILLTNNTYGTGHGISIGSYTDSGGVSNITVINCTINGADNGIRIKSDNDRGGLVHDINYINIGITNVNFPIQIYAYYNVVGTPSSISPNYAATQAVAAVSSTTPIYRNITFSNITATSVSGYPVGLIWARTEMPATNILFYNLNVTGNRNFELYNVAGAQFINSRITCSANTNTFALFDAQVIVTNSAYTNTLFSSDGLTTNGYGNILSFYNARASMRNTNVLDNGPLTLSDSTLTLSNSDLTLSSGAVVNYLLGASNAQLVTTGNLDLGGTNYITAASGFTNGTYTLMAYGGTLSGSPPVLASTPAGYNYSVSTATAGQVNLIVTLLPPPGLAAAATNLGVNLKWNAVTGANTYNLKRGTTIGSYPTVFSGLASTNYTDTGLANGMTYYYVVSAAGAGGESTNSAPVSIVPLPSNQPTNIVMQAGTGQMNLSWPQDHLGWRLQIQTNSLAHGLGTNWSTVPNSTNLDSIAIPVAVTNPGVFLRLIYP